MSLKKILSKPFAKREVRKVKKVVQNPIKVQEKTLYFLIEKAKNTLFGKDHDFKNIKNYEDFKKRVPVVDYETIRKYLDIVIDGGVNVLWEGKPLYYAKTSGTTSGVKYIPITKESMPTHIKSARNAILHYIAETGNSDVVDGKMIFLQGSPKMIDIKGVKSGRLSGIVAHYVPNYLKKNRLPSWETNCIEDWETKVNAIIEETLSEDMRLISGIPSWVQMYFEKLIEKEGKKISEIFPNFSLFIYGGVNYEPYRNKYKELIGKNIDSIEVYSASEGFIAYQDSQKEEGLLLILDNGIFYEFIPTDKYDEKKTIRLALKDVKIGVNYVIILNTTAGLWGYNIGDTVMFTSTKPYRIKVTGRIKHFISAFGEHVISREVEKVIQLASLKHNVSVNEFTVAPQVNPDKGLPYHEWFIEFSKDPKDISSFAMDADKVLQDQNIYYRDLIKGKILKPIQIKKIKNGGFQAYMKSIGKLGEQNKIPKLTNDRKIADALDPWIIK